MTNETNLDAVLNTLDTEDGQCKVTFVAMGCDPAPCKVDTGITIGELREAQGLEGIKLSDPSGKVYKDTDVITEDTKIFKSTAKKNG